MNQDRIALIWQGMERKPTAELLQIVSENDLSQWTAEALETARQVLSERQQIVDSIHSMEQGKDIDGLLEITGHEIEPIQEEALSALTRIGNEKVCTLRSLQDIDGLIDMLSYHVESVREEAVRALKIILPTSKAYKERMFMEEKTLLVIENVLHPPAPLNLKIGDLLLTSKGVYFVCYEKFQYAGSIGEGAGFLIGGLAGGIAASISDRDKLSNAREYAAELRQRIYGLTIRERQEDLKDSLSYPSTEIDGLKYSAKDAQLLVQLKSGKAIPFYIPPLSDGERALIEIWPSPYGRYDVQNDPHGLNISYPSPKKLAQQAEADKLERDVLLKIATNEKYMFALYSQLQKMDRERRLKTAKVLQATPEEFQKALCNAITKDAGFAAWGLVVGVFLMFGGTVLGGGIAYSGGYVVFGLLLGAVVISFGVLALLGALHQRKIGNEIGALLRR